MTPLSGTTTGLQGGGAALGPTDRYSEDLGQSQSARRAGTDEVSFDNVDGAIQGWSDGTRAAVSPAAKYPFKTLVHEIMHCTMRHGQDGHDYSMHRGT